jgi:hypothetical protein
VDAIVLMNAVDSRIDISFFYATGLEIGINSNELICKDYFKLKSTSKSIKLFYHHKGDI